MNGNHKIGDTTVKVREDAITLVDVCPFSNTKNIIYLSTPSEALELAKILQKWADRQNDKDISNQ